MFFAAASPGSGHAAPARRSRRPHWPARAPRRRTPGPSRRCRGAGRCQAPAERDAARARGGTGRRTPGISAIHREPGAPGSPPRPDPSGSGRRARYGSSGHRRPASAVRLTSRQVSLNSWAASSRSSVTEPAPGALFAVTGLSSSGRCSDMAACRPSVMRRPTRNAAYGSSVIMADLLTYDVKRLNAAIDHVTRRDASGRRSPPRVARRGRCRRAGATGRLLGERHIAAPADCIPRRHISAARGTLAAPAT